MIVVAVPDWSNGVWGRLGGFAVPFVYGALALATDGPGSRPVDHAMGADAMSGVPWDPAAAAVAVAVAEAALLPLLLRRRNLRTPPRAPDPSGGLLQGDPACGAG